MHREQIGPKQTDEGMWLGSPEKETEADPKRITFDDLLCRFDTESERKKNKNINGHSQRIRWGRRVCTLLSAVLILGAVCIIR
ncbi:hypothetical protein M5W68_20485 [Paenibacillus larvae]|uniref:hypothetical protein n=1 Tax=Paenibacillus larvae TaxID=1464 RepID=UPI002280AB06|nr:hypothetical protein [Paenibacillus larvae]MCY9512315.1 hypothetical protein [Paenibacillus larvae]MCY9527407.1 hypothetical protein [Paenibacillus larvae]